MKKVRQANIELLRMITMLMITAMHLVNHSGLLTNPYLSRVEYYTVWTVFGFGICSINLYVLISGYFLCDSKFSTYRIIKLATQVFIYSFVITMLFWAFTDVERDVETFMYSFIPILSDFYWFASMYVGMYIMSPIMNKLIGALTKNQLRCTIIVMVALIGAWPNIIYYSNAMNAMGGVSLIWFLTVYLIGAYIKRYYEPDGRWGKLLIIGTLVNLIVPFTKFFIEFLQTTPLSVIPFLDDLLWGYSIFYHYSDIPVTIASILFFMAFLNMKIEGKIVSRVIVFLASSSFGVYLFQEHEYMRGLVWGTLNPEAWMGEWYFIPMIFAGIIAVYLVGTVVEKVRELICSPLMNCRWLREGCADIDGDLKKWWNKE